MTPAAVSLRPVWQTHTLCIHHKVINQTKSHCIFALREWHSIKTITLTWHGDTGIKRVCECWQWWVPGTRVGDESTAAEMLSLLLCVLVVTDERRWYPYPQICTANGAALVNKDQLGKMKQKLWAWKAKKMQNIGGIWCARCFYWIRRANVLQPGALLLLYSYRTGRLLSIHVMAKPEFLLNVNSSLYKQQQVWYFQLFITVIALLSETDCV